MIAYRLNAVREEVLQEEQYEALLQEQFKEQQLLKRQQRVMA